MKAYVDNILQDPDLGAAVDARKRRRGKINNNLANRIMAMIEGWDEEDSESEEGSLFLPEAVSHKT